MPGIFKQSCLNLRANQNSSLFFDSVLQNLLCLPGILYIRSLQVLFREVAVLNADLPCLASLIKLTFYFRIILPSESSKVLSSLDANTFNPYNNLWSILIAILQLRKSRQGG